MAKKTDQLIETPIVDEMEEQELPFDAEPEEAECKICQAKHLVEDSMALLAGALRVTAHDYSGLSGEEGTFVGIEMIQKDAERALATLKTLVAMRELLLKCDCDAADSADAADETSDSGPTLTDYTDGSNPQEGKASPDGVAYDN